MSRLREIAREITVLSEDVEQSRAALRVVRMMMADLIRDIHQAHPDFESETLREAKRYIYSNKVMSEKSAPQTKD